MVQQRNEHSNKEMILQLKKVEFNNKIKEKYGFGFTEPVINLACKTGRMQRYFLNENFRLCHS